jgi:hypothetical protein
VVVGVFFTLAVTAGLGFYNGSVQAARSTWEPALN